jgi:mono/diheme cytochrome c family protein
MHLRHSLASLLIAFVCGLSTPAFPASGQEHRDDYVGAVKPILQAKCVACHGGLKQEGGLRLDTGRAAHTGGDSGPALAAGDASASLLWQRVSATDKDQRMPPEAESLTAAELATLRKWIEAGAPSPAEEVPQPDPYRHWSFQPLPTKPIAVPSPSATAEGPTTEMPSLGGLQTIDAFVAARLRAAGLEFAPPADSVTLVRRMTIDVLGLVPEWPELQRWSQRLEKNPDAIEQFIDTLLASPRRGERFAQQWLDVVRYADTHGFEVNTPRPNAWPYRDYVIAAMNDDLPYNRFAAEQIAGDLSANAPATGFLVASAVLLPGQIGKDDASKRLARQDALDEVVTGASATFFGLTVGCARCHDHKFDPIPQRDYYALQAFFAGIEYGEREFGDRQSAERQRELERLQPQIAKLTALVESYRPLAAPQAASQTDAESRSPDANRPLREPISPLKNVERFAPQLAKFVRFTTLATIDDNKHEPCIDELEIFADRGASNNFARSAGVVVASSGDAPVSDRHKLEHINDGRYGNGRSWMSDRRGGGWVQIELGEAQTIDTVIWGRDRQGKLQDRLPVRYRVELSLDGQHWTLVADHSDRAPRGAKYDQRQWLEHLPEDANGQELSEAFERLERLQARMQQLEQPRVVFAAVSRACDETHLLRRGDPEQPLEKVVPSLPAIVGDLSLAADVDDAVRRRALAEWFERPTSPLVARVIVNRVWQNHFGRGLVDTPSDFGTSGAPPSHPELLDWLSGELIAHQWSLKWLERTILRSRTYQQSSRIDPAAAAVDADNRLLWRFQSRRMSAEAIRDSVLRISGSLNLEMGGPGFDFFKVRGGLTGFPPLEQFTSRELRRMVYAHKIRMERVPVFGAFDCPDAGQASPKRTESTTPIQALNLFNSPFIAQQAEAFAQRLQAECEVAADINADRDRRLVETAFAMALGRLPDAAERAASCRVAAEHGLATLCRVLFNSNEFLVLP